MKCKNCILYRNCNKRKEMKRLPLYKRLICKEYVPISKNGLPPWMKDI